MLIVRPGSAADHRALIALLTAAKLPTVGVPADLRHFHVAEREGRIVGGVGMEQHGAYGLLRSLVVSPAERGTGVGRRLVQRAVAISRARGDAACWLMTDTAREFFPRFGFSAAEREALPAELTGAIDYHGVCPASATMMHRPSGAPVRVLILCTGNSARSQVGEALFAAEGGAMIVAASAGSRPAARVNPGAVEVLAAHGISWDGGTPKHIDAVADAAWDIVITVCDAAKEACPIFPGATIMAHWGLPDPADVEPVDARRDAFGQVYDALHGSTRALLDELAARPLDEVTRALVQSHAPAALPAFQPR